MEIQKDGELNMSAPVIGNTKPHRQRRKKRNSAQQSQPNTERDNNVVTQMEEEAKSHPVIPITSIAPQQNAI